MRLAVPDVEGAAPVHEHAVRARQCAAARVGFGSVAALAGAEHRADDPGAEVDPADDVALGVGDEQPAAPPGQALGAGQERASRRAAVARVALGAGAGHVVDRLRPRVEAMDGVALAQRQVEIAAIVERHRARAVQRRARERRAVGRGLTVAGAGEGGDDAGGQLDRPHAMVADVADEQSPPVGRDRDRVRLAKGGRGRRPAVAREARLSGARQRRDHAGARVHLADDVVVALGDVEVPRRPSNTASCGMFNAASMAGPPSPA